MRFQVAVELCTVGAGTVVIGFEIFHFVCCSSVVQHDQLDIATKGIYSNKLVSRGRPPCMSGSGRQEVAFID